MPESRRHRPNSEPIRSSSLVVLLAVDDPSDGERTSAVLGDELDGARVLRADSLESALAHCAGGDVDVAILALELKDSTGVNTLRRFVAGAPHVPVVVLADPPDESFIREGAQDSCPATPLDLQLVARSARFARERWSVHEDRVLAGVESAGIVGRGMFYRRLREAGARVLSESRSLALLYVDVDGFKAVNDGYGHETGDEVIRCASQRILDNVRDIDTVARLGGDEFAIIIDAIDDTDSSRAVAQRILDAFIEPFAIRGHSLRMTPSIGIASFPEDTDDVGDLVKFADAAMWQAKRRGRNAFCFYEAGAGNRGIRRRALELGLRDALHNSEFVLHYQPQISLATGGIRAVEALLRWARPDSDLISPVEFVPILESTGLIIPVGRWVLHEACVQLAAWRKAGLAVDRISVNLSAIQLLREDFSACVLDALRATSLPAGCLELELTESAYFDSGLDGQSRLTELLQAGVELAIDDFGVGYSTLSALRDLPASTVKIDRSLIQNLERNESSAVIATACIQLLRKLGRQVVAEGVETFAQLEAVRQQGCDAIQGYIFGEPMPARELEEWMGSVPKLIKPAA